ncbi:MAG: tRNA (adenosine(37)-N6)-threonylcarbamoyltransferase complex ATPase subunit type 1 TsaE [Ilumatobacteraceae bacterium]|nr:tRNA (adenosine(37)-N6)-threonylcarbamoyltransferase complex ATPase subunit type 1 TsaE [Ilumatobacteraceae bacterium]
MIELRASDLGDTHAIAGAIAGVVRPRDLIVLVGEMGAGKTAFATGFAKALGVHGDDHVSSPTFTLMHSYTSGRIPMHHADLYRLISLAEVADLGIRELLDMGAVGLVEWGDVASEVLGEGLSVTLVADDNDEDARIISVAVDGHAWDTRWELLKNVLRSWTLR